MKTDETASATAPQKRATKETPMDDPPRSPEPNADLDDYPGTPRWVKVFGIIIAIPVLLFVILMLSGGPGAHGPGRHRPPSSLTEDDAPSGVDRGDHTPPEVGHR